MFSRFSHAVLCFSSLFLSITESYSIVWMDHIWLVDHIGLFLLGSTGSRYCERSCTSFCEG